jgi:DNA-binding response OmpR family regulator
VISREKLITDVWGWHHIGDVSDNSINVTLSRLRKKIGEDFNPKTLYNYWYVLD